MKIELKIVDNTWNDELCEMISVPIPGPLTISLQRSPDYFVGNKVQNLNSNVYVAISKENNDCVGMVSIGESDLYLNGKVEKVKYLSDLRVKPQFRGNNVTYQIINQLLKENILLGYNHTIIFKDNKKMIGGFNRWNDNIEKSKQLKLKLLGTYDTYMFPQIKGGGTQKNIRFCNKEDIPDLIKFYETFAKKKHFFPCYNFSNLNSPYFYGVDIKKYLLFLDENGEINGSIGLWKQSSFKQIKVIKYSKTLSILNPILSNYFKFKYGFKFPLEGEGFNINYLHSILIKDDSIDVFFKMISSLKTEETNEIFLVGLHEKDKLNSVFKKKFPKYKMSGNHYVFSQNASLEFDSDLSFYLEAART